jgi:hypothetical protein
VCIGTSSIDPIAAKRKLALETDMPVIGAVYVCSSISEILLLNCLQFAVYLTEKVCKYVN